MNPRIMGAVWLLCFAIVTPSTACVQNPHRLSIEMSVGAVKGETDFDDGSNIIPVVLRVSAGTRIADLGKVDLVGAVEPEWYISTDHRSIGLVYGADRARTGSQAANADRLAIQASSENDVREYPAILDGVLTIGVQSHPIHGFVAGASIGGGPGVFSVSRSWWDSGTLWSRLVHADLAYRMGEHSWLTLGERHATFGQTLTSHDRLPLRSIALGLRIH